MSLASTKHNLLPCIPALCLGAIIGLVFCLSIRIFLPPIASQGVLAQLKAVVGVRRWIGVSTDTTWTANATEMGTVTEQRIPHANLTID
jgi:hypothetical protein